MIQNFKTSVKKVKMYVHMIHIEQNMSNNRKIGPQHCLISFYKEDMLMFNNSVIKNDSVTKNNIIICFYVRSYHAHGKFSVNFIATVNPIFW